MTNHEKKEHLRRYRGLEREAGQLQEEIQRLYSAAERTTAVLSLVPAGGAGGDRIQDSVEAVDALAARLGEKQREAVELRGRIEDAVEAVQDGRLRELLRAYYIQGRTWEQVAGAMGTSERWIYKLHEKAISSL